MITINEIDKLFSDVRYELDYHDNLLSDRGVIAKKLKSVMEPVYVHMWMVMHPLKGYEHTIDSNISDIATWLLEMVEKAKENNLQLQTIYIECSEHYQRRVKSELTNHHGYPNLSGISFIPMNEIVSVILARIEVDIADNRKFNKKYLPTREKIIDIIKSELEYY